MIVSDTFLDVMTPTALVMESGEISFCNSAFQQIFVVKPGQLLKKEFADLLRGTIQDCHDSHHLVRPGAETSKTDLNDRVVQLNMTHLIGDDPNQQDVWLITVTFGEKAHGNFVWFMKVKNLTPREIDVATLARNGYQDKDISDRLCISVHTVNQHFKNIHKKLGTHSRPELVSCLNDVGP